MENIKLDKRNYRVHSQKNKDLIKKSLTELGAGRSVVIDSEDTLVAGNGVFEQAQKIGMPTKIIETDGTELIVVKRTDLKTDDEKRKKLALADNSISDTSEFDFDVMANDFMIEDLADWGVELPEEKIAQEPKDTELKPFFENHVLISYDINLHDKVMAILKPLFEEEKVEILQSAN